MLLSPDTLTEIIPTIMPVGFELVQQNLAFGTRPEPKMFATHAEEWNNLKQVN